MLFSTHQTEKDFALSYDRHGDSYYDDTTVEELKQVFQKIAEKVRTRDIISILGSLMDCHLMQSVALEFVAAAVILRYSFNVE